MANSTANKMKRLLKKLEDHYGQFIALEEDYNILNNKIVLCKKKDYSFLEVLFSYTKLLALVAYKYFLYRSSQIYNC